MGEQERIRILELAFDLVKSDRTPIARMVAEAGIREWAKLFDQTYKAIMKTALEK